MGWEYQDENGYSINTIYWFKYEPIKWIITEKEEGSNIYYTVMACNILDAQAYQTSLSRQNNRYTGIIVSKSGYNPSYPYVSEGSKSYVDYDIFIEQETRTGDGRAFANNWQSSEIKNWLGIRDSSGNLSGTFATTAFSVADRGLIQNTSLTKNGGWDYYKGDGSTSSTHGFISPTGCYYKKGSDNKYNRTGTFSTYEITYSDPNNYNNDVLGNKALENNYIWLPSYQEIYEDYAETNIYDQAPNAVAKPTGYAMAQGAYCQHWDTDPFTKESAREYKGNGTYWLRTSSGRNTSRINFVASNGVLGFTDVDKRINAISNCDEVNATYYGIRPMTRVEGK